MNTVTFTYLNAKCEYNYEYKNLHIISHNSFTSPKQANRTVLSKKYHIKKEDIHSITFKYKNTKLPKYVYDYFSNFQNLKSIEFDKLSFENVEYIDRFIENCPKLKNIQIINKEAKNLKYIKNFITHLEHTKSITIKDINAPNLKSILNLLTFIKNIKEITIKDITAPNMHIINYLLLNVDIKKLDLKHIKNTNVKVINILISNCKELEELHINKLSNTEEIKLFLENIPRLKTKIIDKIANIKKLNKSFLYNTAKNEPLDLTKFKDITLLADHIKNTNQNIYNKKNSYTQIIQGNHQLSINDYIVIFKYNIKILDKSNETITNDIIQSGKTANKETLDTFLKEITHQNNNYELLEKLNIIKQLKE